MKSPEYKKFKYRCTVCPDKYRHQKEDDGCVLEFNDKPHTPIPDSCVYQNSSDIALWVKAIDEPEKKKDLLGRIKI